MLTSVFDVLSESQQSVVENAIKNAEVDLLNPAFYSDALVYNTPGVTQFSLARLAECESNQNPINTIAVFNKILKPLVTVDEFTLYYPVEVGFIDDDDTYYIMSGHHRTAALLTLVDAVERVHGLNPGELLEQLTVPVVMRPYHPALLLAANQSRSIGRGEKINISLARMNIDTWDIDELRDAASRNVPGALMRAAYILCHESDNETLYNLTDSTVANITRSAVSKLSKRWKLNSTKFAPHALLFLDDFVAALTHVLSSVEISNIARSAPFIGEQIAKWFMSNGALVNAVMSEKRSQVSKKTAKLSKTLSNTRKRVRNPIQPVEGQEPTDGQLTLFE